MRSRAKGIPGRGIVLGLMLAWMAAISLSLAGRSAALDSALVTCSSQNFPFISVTMRVTDGGTPINPALGPGNFVCSEDSVVQLDQFRVTPPDTTGGVRVADIVFLIDRSGSMSDEIAAVDARAEQFADALAASGIDYRLGMVKFGNDGDGDTNPFVFGGGNMTTDISVFKNWLHGPTPGGTEPGFHAIRLAISTFAFRPGAQIVFVIITDEDADEPIEFTNTINLVKANGIVVHAAVDCNFGSSNTHYCDAGSVTDESGGMVFPVAGDPVTGYEDILDLIGSGIGSSYILQFRSTNRILDGNPRTVTCTASSPTLPPDTSVQCTYTPGAEPRIELTSATQALLTTAIVGGSAPTIGAIVTDAAAPFVQDVTLFYRTTNSGDPYQSVPMLAVGGDVYEASIPIEVVISPGVDFYVRATDGTLSSSLPSVDPGDNPFQIAVLPNQPPVITHTPVTTSALMQDIVIEATVTDTTNFLDSVELHWRYIGDLIFNDVPMTPVGGDDFSATIAGADVVRDIEYYIRAVDNLTLAATAATPDAPFLITVGSSTVIGLDCPPRIPPGGGFNSDLTVDVGSRPLGSYAVTFTWDPALLQLDDVQGGSTTEFAGAPTCNIDNTQGQAFCTAFQASRLDGPTGVVHLATLQILSSCSLGDLPGVQVGSVQLFETSGLPISAGVGSSCSPECGGCGDVNGDASVDIGDALAIAQYQVQLIGCGQFPFSAPDVCDINPQPPIGNFDGLCNIGDAQRIAFCAVGLVGCDFDCSPFSCGGGTGAMAPSPKRRDAGMPVRVSLRPESETAAPGDRVVVDVVVEADAPLGAYDVAVRCDDDVYSIIGVEAAGSGDFAEAPVARIEGCSADFASFQASPVEHGEVEVARVILERRQASPGDGSGTVDIESATVYRGDGVRLRTVTQGASIGGEPAASSASGGCQLQPVGTVGAWWLVVGLLLADRLRRRRKAARD